MKDGQKAPSPFLDISGEISSGGERGLLGLAFHPGFPDDPRVFVDYTNVDGNTVVASFEPGLDADALDPASERQIITIKQPYANHNGGALAFDATGKLLVGMGDGGSGGDPEDRAENGQELLGKILRLDVDAGGAKAYAIPDDNPFVDGPNRPEIAHLGMRNPWRLSIDRATGDLWIGDVGQGAIEEIDVARNGQLGLRLRVEHARGDRVLQAQGRLRHAGQDDAGRGVHARLRVHRHRRLRVSRDRPSIAHRHLRLRGLLLGDDVGHRCRRSGHAGGRQRDGPHGRARSARTRRARSISPISAPARSCGSRPATDPRAPAGVARQRSGALRLSRGSAPRPPRSRR